MKSRRGKIKLSNILIAIFAVVCAVFFYFNESSADTPIAFREDKLNVYFIDVGQGDGALVVTPDGKRMLIDAGTGESEDYLVSFLKELDCERIDKAVFTHPHEDHIGGADAVIENFEVGEVIMPDAVSTSLTYEKLLSAIDERDVPVSVAEPGAAFMLGDSVEVEMLGPVVANDDELNDSSVVLRLEYGLNSFLFTGDAESTAEDAMLEAYTSGELKSDVLKVGHHGSSGASSAEFLAAVTPECAVISCGEGNSYGHPHKETLSRLSDIGARVLRTDELGTVLLVSDGADISYISR